MFHNNGLDSVVERGSGRGGVTGNQSHDGTWKTPTLRNWEYTAPYMHDGRLATMEDVIDFYVHNVDSTSRNVDPLVLKRYDPGKVPLTAEEKADLLAFLKTLNDPDFISNSAYSSPF